MVESVFAAVLAVLAIAAFCFELWDRVGYTVAWVVGRALSFFGVLTYAYALATHLALTSILIACIFSIACDVYSWRFPSAQPRRA